MFKWAPQIDYKEVNERACVSEAINYIQYIIVISVVLQVVWVDGWYGSHTVGNVDLFNLVGPATNIL